jgi:hypothetical protein
MVTKIQIMIDVSDEALVGAEGWNDCDPDATIAAFLNEIRRDLVAEYPDADIEIEDHRNGLLRGAITIVPEEKWQEAQNVLDIMQDVYQRGNFWQ